MDEIALARNIAEGKRAEMLIKDEAYQRWSKQLESELVDAWIGSSPRDIEGREYLFKQIHAGRKWHDLIRKIATNGKLAQRDLETRKRRSSVA